ncbi:MAG: Crp/Fnr family transcriptional regulator, partial [Turicibacter sp.]|nr:Crp/Fnr family transcriptional regulator [Turicibacter sp.]
TAVAVEKTVVVKVPRELLEIGILSTEGATREWFRQLNRRLEGVQQLLTDQVFIDAKERFKKWLKRFISSDNQCLEDEIVIKIPVTKQEIADLLSIWRETFSRMLAELKEDGVCEVKGKIFKISRIWLIEEK